MPSFIRRFAVFLNPLKNNRFGCLPAGKLTLSGEREPLVLIIVYNTALLNAA